MQQSLSEEHEEPYRNDVGSILFRAPKEFLEAFIEVKF